MGKRHSQHLREAHEEDLGPVVAHLIKPDDPMAMLSVYNEAIAQICRADAPVAGCSLDRTALKAFASAMADDKVESLVCFSCACVFPRVAEVGEKGKIDWHRPVQGEKLFGTWPELAAKILGVDEFLNKYDELEGGRKLSERIDFKLWQLTAPMPGGNTVALLGCPEDHRCRADPSHVQAGVLCEQCEVPLCAICKDKLSGGSLPCSLANDMLTGYAPQRLYTEEATVMELICCSPCVTTLICLSMEQRHRQETAPMDETAHMRRHRYGARGNALTFPLPWEDLFQILQAQERRLVEPGGAPALPRTEEELADTVRVLLKTNKTGCATDAEVKTLIHQANVRRRVVVAIILDLKAAGHPAYTQVDADAVRQKADTLPEDGVPPAVLAAIQIQDDDTSQEKPQPQKAATPTDGRHALAAQAGEAFAVQRPRGVVAEGTADTDINRAIEAELQRMAEELTPDGLDRAMLRVEMRTGNQLVDQFNSGYMALAFPFLFPHETARPDVVNHCRQQQVHEGNPAIVWADRQRGPIKVPIMEWAACMQRRVEAQFRRDWTFLFTVWNYLFRTLVNLQKNTYMFAVPNEAGPGLRMLTSAKIGKATMELYLKLCRRASMWIAAARERPSTATCPSCGMCPTCHQRPSACLARWRPDRETCQARMR